MALHDKTKKRREFLAEFFQQHADVDVSLDELRAKMAAATDSPPLSTGQLGRLLRLMGAPVAGAQLSVGRKVARLDIVAQYVIEQRRRQRTREKSWVGRALWAVLLGAPLPANLKLRPADKLADRLKFGWSPSLERRLRDLQAATSLAIYADAGSTTEAAFNELGDYASLNFASDREITPRLRIITSSLSIARLLCQGRLKHSVQGVIVGGELRPEYESIGGLITQQILPHFDAPGSVALIGATGYRSADLHGGPCFLCSSLEESFIKSSFLKMADLRVVAMDSSKLLNSAPQRSFATLRTVDLVITDDGCLTENLRLPEAVKRFCKEAKDHGVATAVVGMS
jgi:DeoR/GlpR family transcriptional regulator of sugar metabolism